MSKQVTKLMTLGAISAREPIGGYGIERLLESWAVARWTTISAASIYQQLRTLSTRGLIEEDEASGGRASLYRITPAGTAELRAMLLDLLGERDIRPLSLIPLLHFTPALRQDELDAGLAARIERIDAALAAESQMIGYAEAAGPSHVTEIFRLTWEGLRADRTWCAGFRDRLAKASSPTAP